MSLQNAINWLAGDPSDWSPGGFKRGFADRLAGSGIAQGPMGNFIGPMSQTKAHSVVGAYGRGALSSILPIEMMSKQEKEAMLKGLGGGGGFFAPLTDRIPDTVKRIGSKALGLAGRLMGPAVTTYRLATETSGRGLAGGIWKGGRIVGEEMAWGGGMAAGMSIGAAVTAGITSAKIGGAIGSFAGPIGTIAGLGAGMVVGAAGAYTIGKLFDAAEVPFKMARAGWNYLKETGRQSAKLELGGRISRGNRTRLAHTMRQRALGQMNRSGINARSLLGQESSMMHFRFSF
jgi:hypothetical protein